MLLENLYVWSLTLLIAVTVANNFELWFNDSIEAENEKQNQQINQYINHDMEQ